MKTAIIIPARYASTRLPGKPLVMIHGKTLLQRVVEIAQAAAEKDMKNISVYVATDDDRIVEHCRKLNVEVVMTDPKLLTGTDRVAEAVKQLKDKPDFILNMQGDAPLTPPDFLRAMIDSFIKNPCDVITPVAQLNWEELEQLREDKKTTPYSGTTVVFDENTALAFWFSKNIIPVIRNEKEYRKNSDKSPVYRQIGLYGYSHAMLQKYVTLPESKFEKLEGLEQLRLLENHYKIRCVTVDYKNRANMSGVDSAEDVLRAEVLIKLHGELL